MNNSTTRLRWETFAMNLVALGMMLLHPSVGAQSPSFSSPTSNGPTADQIVPDLETLDRLHSPILRKDLRIRGAQSCASASCHGGPRPGVATATSKRGSEYALWLENDPHARSWRTMTSQQSVEMLLRLNILNARGQVIDEAGFDNCLACHNSTKRFTEPRTRRIQTFVTDDSNELCGTCPTNTSRSDQSNNDDFRQEGVGCSGCHGPSDAWIGTHTERDFFALGATESGFVASKDLYTRARMCASCHVGDSDRDMNHDMIAAGHPALRYEFATFHSRLPKHWRDEASKDADGFEAQLWLAGQIAATDASLALLHSRASQRMPVSQWPEFSAYDCASCHHTLGFDDRQNSVGKEQRAIVSYSNWNDSGLRWVLRHRIDTDQATKVDWELLTAIDEVRQIMQSSPTPESASIADAARHARKILARWFDDSSGTTERSITRSHRITQVIAHSVASGDALQTWESAAQFYLATVASRSAWPGGLGGPCHPLARQLRAGLRYPDKSNSRRLADHDGDEGFTRQETQRVSVELARWFGLPSSRAEHALESAPSRGSDQKEISDQQELDALIELLRQRSDERNRRLERKLDELRKQQREFEQSPPKSRLQSDEELKKELDNLSDDPN